MSRSFLEGSGETAHWVKSGSQKRLGRTQIPFAQQPWKKPAPLASDLNVKHMLIVFPLESVSV